MSRLIGLRASNVKKLRAVNVRNMDVPLFIVRGKNGAAKSSFLDAIRYTLGGKSTHPPRVIRDGEQDAFVELETDDFIALRRWTKGENGAEETELELRAKAGGDKMKSPQAMLDKLYADIAFDPLAFTRMKPEAQADLVRKMAGVDVTEIDRSYLSVFEQRTGLSRDLKAEKARLAAYTETVPPPDKVDVSALLKEKTMIATARSIYDRAVYDRNGAFAQVHSLRESVKTAEAALAQVKAKLATAEQAWAQADNAVDNAATDEADPSNPRTAQIEEQIQKASAIATAHERWSAREKLVASTKTREAEVAAATKQLDDLDAKKAAMLAEAKFPVPGLTFGGAASAGLLLNGLPLEQASQSEQLRLSIAVGIASNPKLRVMISRDGSLLDSDSLALVEKLCEENDMTALLEMVGEEGPASIVLVDGAVRP